MALGGLSNWRSRIPTRTPSRVVTRRPVGAPTGLQPGAILTGAGRSTTSPGAGVQGSGINRTAADIYWGVPYAGETGTREEYLGFANTVGNNPDIWMNTAAPAVPAAPSYGGGGRGYGGGGGGGGGGGAAPMTQAMFDAMLRAIGAVGPGLQLSQVDLPDFQGQSLGAFNAAPYTQALGNIDTAVAADLAASQQAGAQAGQALQANYSNAYANAPVTQAPAAQQVGGALQATAGGGGQQAQIAAQTGQAAQSDQASFQNLLNVLAAADQTAQASRMNQVSLDQATAGRNINAQALGLRGGVNMAQSQAANTWAQQAAEREYQNRLMAQQWTREEMTRNQDIANQQAQGNWQQRNEMIANRLTPLLQLLQGTGGSAVNTDALQQLLAQWQAS